MKGKNEWQERPAKRRKSIKEETESKLEQSFLQSSFEDAYPAIIEKLSLNMDGWLGSKELMEQLKVQPLATVMSLEPEKLLKIYKFTTKKLKSNNKMEPIYCLDANPLSSLVSSRLGLWSRLWEEYGKVKFLIYFQCFLTLKNGKLEFNIGIFILDSIKAPEEAIMASGTSSIYTSLIDQIFPSPFIESRKDTQINTNLFYDNARQLAKSLPTVDVRRDKRLLSDLLPFQRRSLEWMIHREKDSSKDSCSLPPLWNEYQLPHNDRKVFVNRTYGYITLSKENVFQLAPAALKGGVLADEMGMGKTLEVLSLVLFHQPPIDKLLSTQFDSVLQKNVIFSKATLIITPSTILDQWISEVELHVPSLKISHYKGIRKSSGSFSLDQFLDADIVITSYSDLRFELLYAESFSRNLRHEKRHVPPKSPLIDICWWRICVDEAQMVETSQSNVAQMIYRIPRVNCWAVSGTPVRGNVDDLFGLLFLFRYSPIYQHRKQTWIQIMELNRVHEFCDIFSPLVCRNCKQDIAHELRLPPQHRRYMPTRLTVVEETNYQDLLTEAAKSLKYLDDQLLDLSQLDTMKRWLIRLRQACCHPQVGSGNKSAFGGGPMKSINDVLMFMLEQTNSSLSSTKRQFFSDVVTTGWVFDHLQDYGKALAIWNEILPTVETVVVDLEGAISRTEIDPDESKSHLNLSYAGLNYPGNIRAWQVLLHKVYFFIASTNFALKNEELEKKYYSLAQDLRRKMMSDIIKKTSKHIDEFGKQFSRKNFVVLPKLPKASSKGTILSYLVVEDYEQLREQLNLQAESLVKFRDRLIYLMKLPLLDQESDPTGDEYEESLNAQSEISYCIDVYRQMISDRVAAIDGTINTFVSHETELEKYKLLENIENAQEIGEKETEERNKKYMLFFEEREEARPKTNEYGTFENILARLADALGRSNTSSEYTIAQRLFEQLNEVTKDQSKTCRKLEKELSLIQLTYNMRIDYYKHLQEISDSLIPPTAPKVSQSQASYIKMEQKDLFESALRHAEEKYNKKLEEEEQSSKSKPASESLDEMISRIDIPAHLLLLKELSTEKQNNLRKIGHFESRLRYLSNLYEHAVFKAGSKQQCIICRDIIKKGFITTCGHFYCKDCLVAWLKHHPSCPMCKSKLTKNSAYYIGEGFDIRLRQEFVLGFPNKEKDLEVMDEETLKQIVSIPLKVSFGSKIDAIVRHLTYLKRIELYPKVVVFSQWLDVLEVLHKSFEANGVSYLRFDGKTKISCLKNFKADRDIEVLTLHSRSQSAGLTLTNATHVIMCEPLLNSGIELQAISRVHRIGQTRPTYVYYYIVEDTVEDHIMSMSIQKHKQLGRLGLDVPLIGSIQRSTDSSFGGEVVDESEIRECLKTALKRLDLEGEEGL
ncbi:ATP-dependent DNA helicase, variant [Schizosaccharomyces cryophilus OY26]|uniref:ATP-dependent DNA helicase, variant n=1 Tax=Schizosaccharomyces cryophilus (strain OY26 / ATCC MYA-4695 / CBS 11777 / NBRC 106824 / NRRL Y48691) TaxID=653667 RepID=S9X926_SCHCR|nr:ATP-dependent DNA helicase, variant [Schizosaccharomyces cryophilus OY26]EPY50316.1 ATP-dependent DNA helicase, variant [Schizosaccharomyces cryophilus OY26]